MGSAPRPPTQEQVQKSGSIFPTPKLKAGATQQGRPVQNKKAFSPPTLDFQARFDFSAGARDSPETAQTSRSARLSSRFPPWWTWEVGAQPERTRIKKGWASGGEERGENAGPGDRGLGLCRPVELTPSSCPQRPSSQLPSVLEFRMLCAPPPKAARGMSPAARLRSWHCGGSRTVLQRSHLPLPALARRAPKPALEGLHDARRTRPERQCWGRRQ